MFDLNSWFSIFTDESGQLFWVNLLIVLSVTLIVGLGWSFSRGTAVGKKIERLEYPLLDLRHRWYASRADVAEDVVLVTITEQSMETFKEKLGRWPWPRRVWARLIQYLGQADRVAFDIGFWEQSPLEVSRDVVRGFRQQLDRYRRLRRSAPEKSNRILKNLRNSLSQLEVSDDKMLARASANSGQVIHNLTFKAQPGSGYGSEILRRQGWRSVGKSSGVLYESLVTPIKPLVDSSQMLAHISFSSDPDGVARNVQLFAGVDRQNGEPRYFPLLGLSPQLSPETRKFSYGDRELKVGEYTIPVDHRGRTPVRYRGNFAEYKAISIEKIILPLIRGRSPPVGESWFEGKTVFVGATAASLFDLRSTPVSPAEPGMGIHAAVYGMVESGDYLAPERLEHTLLSVGLTGFLVGVSSISLGPFLALAVLLVWSGGLVAGGFALFASGQIINLSLPLLTGVISYVGVTTRNVFREEQKRQFVREVFQHYLPESVMETVLSDPESLQLRARRKRVTMLFMDIAGFTTLSEGLDATDVAVSLNELLSAMSRCVFENEGVVDKFIGDELMAEFGLLEAEPPEPEKRACRAADAMLKALRRYNRENEEEPLDIRIGLNTGFVAAGNMGSEELFDYTVIGDAVNLGSRLEGVNKFYGSKCMLSQSTAEQLGDFGVVREIDSVRVKGREQPVKIYQWMGLREDLDEAELQRVEVYETALEHYRDREFEPALELLEDLPETDAPAVWLREQCTELLESPPDEDWEPITKLTSK